MFDPFDNDYPDPSDAEGAFQFGRSLYAFVYAFFAGHFVTPTSLGQQVARWTAIPSCLLGITALVYLIVSGPSYALQVVLCLGGLIWFCYTSWAIYMVEQTYVIEVEKAQREEL